MTTKGAYYNEFDEEIAVWLAASMEVGLIPAGDIDTRDIREVSADDLKGYTQHHFFAGIGGWPLALRRAGWPDSRPVWTGSCPCQPFSTAGQGKGNQDERHLWPSWFKLIQQYQPSIIFGEQVASAIAHGWMDEVCDDMEAQNYTLAAAVLPACGVGAPHRRDRLWFVAHAEGYGLEQAGRSQQCETERAGGTGALGNAEYDGQPSCEKAGVNEEVDGGGAPKGEIRTEQPQGASLVGDVPVYVGDTLRTGLEGHPRDAERGGESGRLSPVEDGSSAKTAPRFVECPDRRLRQFEPSIRLLANGIPKEIYRVALQGYGNAIHPEVATQFILSTMEAINEL